MITRDEILMGREKQSPLNKDQEDNLSKLLIAVNIFRKAYGKPMIVTSGYRPSAINAAIGGAKKSSHMSCQAVDFKDTDGKLAKWCLENIKVLEDARLYMEDPESTKGWVHLQIRPTRNRVFKP